MIFLVEQFINTNYGKLIFIYRDKNDLITQINELLEVIPDEKDYYVVYQEER